ncbi:hypothetical protein BH09PSE5_BH09PSE5_28730 [soil metagenome]
MAIERGAEFRSMRVAPGQVAKAAVAASSKASGKAAAKPATSASADNLAGKGAVSEEMEKPRRGGLQDRVAQQMKRALMVGQFVPGQPMSIRQLATRLGTSPMPVREVISQLTAAGVLEVLPNRSVCVAHMTEARFSELINVRVALEGLAAGMACENQTPALIKELEKINADLLKSIAARDILGCLSNNQAFHFTLYAASKAEILPGMIEALWLRSGPFMYFSFTDPSTPWNAVQHSEVIDTLRAGKPAATRRAIERDIADTAKYIIKRSNVFTSGVGPLSHFNGSFAIGV